MDGVIYQSHEERRILAAARQAGFTGARLPWFGAFAQAVDIALDALRALPVNGSVVNWDNRVLGGFMR